MNIFDGQDGRSNGTANGSSIEIVGDGGFYNIFVTGTFGGASVTLQKYVHTSDSFDDTGAVFTSPDVFQGLVIKPSDIYRLTITNKSGSTAIIAEVS